ncbi:MAG: bifunctional riboflavin kinase/FAD synthetase [candidate division WOR-3 bacterium]
MKLLRISDKLEEETCACIGSFDGMHIGHKAIIEDVKCYAQLKGLKSLIITFREHPRLEKNLLFTPKEKLEALKKIGIDYVLLLEREDMEITALEFLNILKNNFKVKRLVMGFNHRFGKNREGDPSFILSHLSEFPFELVIFPPIKVGDIVVSSTNIRNMLLEGRVDEVIPLLGRRYSIVGRKVKGAGLGKNLGFPTVNLEVEGGKLIPKDGVYVVFLPDLGKYGVMHIGNRPTFSLDKSLEVHILDFDGDIGDTLRVEFVKRIRDVMRFKNGKELKERILKDIEVAKRVISSAL